MADKDVKTKWKKEVRRTEQDKKMPQLGRGIFLVRSA